MTRSNAFSLGPKAAQVVPHLHFHIIPRTDNDSTSWSKSWTMFGRGSRQSLDDDEATILAQRIRQTLEQELDSVRLEAGPAAVDALLAQHTHRTTEKL